MHIASIPLGSGERGGLGRFRPYTGGGADLRAATDPINLVFIGEPDVRGIRAALKGLGAGRSSRWSGLADSTALWSDAVGAAQTAYSPEHGWSAGAVQLELGEFSGRRAHLRLFPFPTFVLGAAHLEVLPPGRFEHSVVSWVGGEQLVVRELARAGVVRHHTSRTVDLAEPRRLQRAGVPAELLGISGYRHAPDVGEPIPGWGGLSVVTLDGLPAGNTSRHFRWSRLTVDAPLVLPSIAASSNVRIRGPVDVEHEVWSERGRLRSRTVVAGDLMVGIADRSIPATVTEWQIARVHDQVGRIRTARRYLTNVRSIDSLEVPSLPHRVQSRVDRTHGPDVRFDTM